MTDLREAVQTFATAALSLALAVDGAQEIQWEPSPIPKPREDTSQRAQGGHGDPTQTITLDPRRLEVREAVEEALAELARATKAASAARAHVEHAVARWHGDE